MGILNAKLPVDPVHNKIQFSKQSFQHYSQAQAKLGKEKNIESGKRTLIIAQL